MKVLNIYPDSGTGSPGEVVKINVSILVEVTAVVPFLVEVFHLNEKKQSFVKEITLETGEQHFSVLLEVPPESPRGYLVNISCQDPAGLEKVKVSTAFDVLEDWTQFPRYGFLTDFFEDQYTNDDRIQSLLKYHINGIQFYDWQYRHDQLMPPTKEFIDPLGRQMSLKVIETLISDCHKAGIKAMPYLAVYAASLDFAEKHPSWRLYDEDQEPFTFEGFLGIMDPSPGSPWTNHLIQECCTVLEKTDFDGLHIDQYGDPKIGWNHNQEIVDIPTSFNKFICRLRDEFPKAALTFNAVGNWPIEALATAPQDFVYIEVWEPTPYYEDLREMVLNARKLSNGKPVVIAQYLQNSQIPNIRLSDAIIYACGGSRIEIGEVDRLLTDPYYPNHKEIPPELGAVLKQYMDFVVAYGELIGPMAENIILSDVVLPDNIWLIAREKPGWITLNLINFSGLEKPQWFDNHAAPQPKQDFWVGVPAAWPVRDVWWARPDTPDQILEKCEWRLQDGRLQIKVPIIDYWTMVTIQMEG